MANFVEMIKLAEELLALFQELKANGTLDKLLAAEGAVQQELANDPKLKDLLTKLEALKTLK